MGKRREFAKHLNILFPAKHCAMMRPLSAKNSREWLSTKDEVLVVSLESQRSGSDVRDIKDRHATCYSRCHPATNSAKRNPESEVRTLE